MNRELPPQLFILFRTLIEERAGMKYELADRDALGDRIGPRLEDLGMDSLLDYYYYLRYDPGGAEELDSLVEELVVGETYFFRELEPLEIAVHALIRPLVERGARPRIWSAACATGEEPLTLAMILATDRLLDRVEIVASDISRRALDRAREGKFSLRSIRRTQPPAFARGWMELTGDRPQVRRELREAIRWTRVNLVSPTEVRALGRFDLILCRNVLIYFSEETARRVVARLAESLQPDGALLVGISESLLRFGSSLVLEERQGASFYRRKAE